ncbi:MAG: response regulator [Vibrio gallaecicus]
MTQSKPENHQTETPFNNASENKGKSSQSKLSKAKTTVSKDSSDDTEPPANLTEGVTTSILIAEDNNVNSIILTKLLNQLGYQGIDHAEDGSKAVNMALDKHYDIILMDHHMPKMTGLDATNVLLKEHKLPTTIIACTADVSKLVQQQFQDLGVKGVIHKPIDKHMLAEILDENTQQSSTPSNNSTNKGVA